MGPADPYAVVESFDEVADSLVVGVDRPDGGSLMPVFVALTPTGKKLEVPVKRILEGAPAPESGAANPAALAWFTGYARQLTWSPGVHVFVEPGPGGRPGLVDGPV